MIVYDLVEEQWSDGKSKIQNARIKLRLFAIPIIQHYIYLFFSVLEPLCLRTEELRHPGVARIYD